VSNVSINEQKAAMIEGLHVTLANLGSMDDMDMGDGE